MFFVHHDQAEIMHRGKQCRARANNNLRLAGTDAVPLVVALAVRQRAVQNGHPLRLIGKTRAEAIHRLRRQRNFRYQHNRAFALLQRTGNRLQINFGLTGTGYAVKQKYRRFRFYHRVKNLFQRTGLLRHQSQRFSLEQFNAFVRIAVN